MDKLDEMMQIGIDALGVLERLKSYDADTVKTAMEDHLRLADRFYRENYEMVAPQQYEAARKDYGYFLRLVYLALEYYGEDVRTG